MFTKKLCICIFFCFTSACCADDLLQEQNSEQTNSEKEVQVQPDVKDQDISKRLTNILNETGWFSDVHIVVREGIVFLYGIGDTDEHVKWACKLAKRTENVIAVVNIVSVKEPTILDSIPIWSYVQSVNNRSTVLLTLEGNYIQIPNAIIYKEIITNYTANPLTRDELLLGLAMKTQ